MNKDKTTTEFFIKGIFWSLLDNRYMAEYNFYIAALTFEINKLYQKEILDNYN